MFKIPWIWDDCECCQGPRRGRRALKDRAAHQMFGERGRVPNSWQEDQLQQALELRSPLGYLNINFERESKYVLRRRTPGRWGGRMEWFLSRFFDLNFENKREREKLLPSVSNFENSSTETLNPKLASTCMYLTIYHNEKSVRDCDYLGLEKMKRKPTWLACSFCILSFCPQLSVSDSETSPSTKDVCFATSWSSVLVWFWVATTVRFRQQIQAISSGRAEISYTDCGCIAYREKENLEN